MYPDKEHEARYTEIVRRYLDFDVEMVNIGSFWKNSENLITEYNQAGLLETDQIIGRLIMRSSKLGKILALLWYKTVSVSYNLLNMLKYYPVLK